LVNPEERPASPPDERFEDFLGDLEEDGVRERARPGAATRLPPAAREAAITLDDIRSVVTDAVNKAKESKAEYKQAKDAALRDVQNCVERALKAPDYGEC
jgi:hypothetical protein